MLTKLTERVKKVFSKMFHHQTEQSEQSEEYREILTLTGCSLEIDGVIHHNVTVDLVNRDPSVIFILKDALKVKVHETQLSNNEDVVS